MRYKKQSSSLKPGERLLLPYFARYRYLAVEQALRALRYKHGMITTVRTRCAHLASEHYLQQLFLRNKTRSGSAPNVFTLGARGYKHLLKEGWELPRYHFTEEQSKSGSDKLQHDVEAIDFLISVDLFCEDTPNFEVLEMLQDRELRRRPAKVTLPALTGKDARGKAWKLPAAREEHPYAVIPDALVVLENAGEPVPIVFEYDHNQHKTLRFLLKLHALTKWARGAYQERYGYQDLTIAFFTSGGPKRLEWMVSAAEQILTATQQRNLADLFLFAQGTLSEIEPGRLLFQPLWIQPFSRTPVPLVEDRSR